MSETVSTFEEMAAETLRMAKQDGKLYYLYKSPGFGNFNWGISAQHWDDWLFRAYPGGRKELSMKGKELAQELGILPLEPGGQV